MRSTVARLRKRLSLRLAIRLVQLDEKLVSFLVFGISVLGLLMFLSFLGRIGGWVWN